MNANALDWFLFHIGSLILVISVTIAALYAAREFRQIKKGQSSIAYQGITGANYQLGQLYIQYPAVYRVMQGTLDIESLDDDGRTRLDWITIMTLDFLTTYSIKEDTT